MLNANIDAILSRWRLESPIAYRWIEAIAALETADHIIATNNLFDLEALDVQDALFPIEAADNPLTTTPVSQGAAPVTQVTTQVLYTPPKPRRRIETLQHHPLMSVKVPNPTPKGWRVSITRAVARQIAAYCLGRPSCEWSALAAIDTHWSKDHTASYVVRELFFCDAGQDAGGHSRIPAEWEMKLVDKLLTANRDEDIPKLFGHVHSHNSMVAFWSGQDVLMCGQRLDDMSAASGRQEGVIVSIVVANNLTARARMDWFKRLDGQAQLVYGTFDPVPLTLSPPSLIAVKDVQSARATMIDTAPIWRGYGATIWDDNDLEAESWYDYNRRAGVVP